tara:strand:- start:1361 stop:2446 length:1086 start_codon:yes stop_codon:yes gene_type:complete
MNKSYYSLGLMSGTSMDGVDASIIQSNGIDEYKPIVNEYCQYNKDLYKNLNIIRDKINESQDLKTLNKELILLEKEITLFHAEIVSKIIRKIDSNIHLIGFHGQTIFHNAAEKISKQLGDGKLLSKLTKKIVVYDFRQNDLKNGGQGAPLTPIFHTIISNKLKKRLTSFLNIGGITNETVIQENGEFSARDIGPGNCLIDKWFKLNSDKIFDENGNVARSGKVNKIILDQSLDTFYNNDISHKKSYDVNDFDLSFVRGLSLEDGAATLTDFTSEILSKKILSNNIYVSGGGRKNQFLIERIENKIKSKLRLIDELDIDGDFVESQAFAFLAIRSYLKLPITFPKTTGCKNPTIGGLIIKNF